MIEKEVKEVLDKVIPLLSESETTPKDVLVETWGLLSKCTEAIVASALKEKIGEEYGDFNVFDQRQGSSLLECNFNSLKYDRSFYVTADLSDRALIVHYKGKQIIYLVTVSSDSGHVSQLKTMTTEKPPMAPSDVCTIAETIFSVV